MTEAERKKLKFELLDLKMAYNGLKKRGSYLMVLEEFEYDGVMLSTSEPLLSSSLSKRLKRLLKFGGKTNEKLATDYTYSDSTLCRTVFHNDSVELDYS